MPGRGWPAQGYPLSIAELGRHLKRGPLYEFLEHFAHRDVLYGKDDFFGDTINLDWYAVANGGGASVASFALNVQEDGVIRATTGTASGDTTTCSLITAANFYGDRQSGVEFRWKPVTAVTEARIELGFVDVIPGSTKPFTNVLATPSVNTSIVDAAYYCYDHTGSTTTNQLTAIGTSISATLAAITAPTAIAAATYNVVRLQLGGPSALGNFAKCWMDGTLVATLGGTGTNAIEGGSALALAALIRASNGTSKSLDLDYIEFWKLRGT